MCVCVCVYMCVSIYIYTYEVTPYLLFPPVTTALLAVFIISMLDLKKSC